jgi:hypothetical protein
MDTANITAAIRNAWSPIPPPPAPQMQYIAEEWGEETLRAFLGIPPMEVDTYTPEFLGCTPLLDLAPSAAAAYLGTYLLSLLEGLAVQERIGVFPDLLTRAHVLNCILQEHFWRTVIRPYLPPPCRQALVDLAYYLVARRELLALTAEETGRITTLATAF